MLARKLMPTIKKRLTFTPESNEQELLATLAQQEGVSMSRMMGLLIRRAWEAHQEKNIQASGLAPSPNWNELIRAIQLVQSAAKEIENPLPKIPRS